MENKEKNQTDLSSGEEGMIDTDEKNLRGIHLIILTMMSQTPLRMQTKGKNPSIPLSVRDALRSASRVTLSGRQAVCSLWFPCAAW